MVSNRELRELTQNNKESAIILPLKLIEQMEEEKAENPVLPYESDVKQKAKTDLLH